MARSSGSRAACLLVAITFLLGLSPPAVAQAITYEYDALGRLILVSAPEGIARYEYDAVGNILRIRSGRYADTTDSVAILMLTPTAGPIGTEVHLYGKGFSSTPGNNQIAFSGTPATVTAATAHRLVTTVPPGATTGLITLTTPTGSAVSPESFTVLGALAVVPAEADVAAGSSFAFAADAGGGSAPPVTWRVNGVVGGSASMGTISPAGLYTAPPSLPAVQPVTVEALLVSDPAQGARATVRVTRQAAGLVQSAPLTVGLATSTLGQVVAAPLTVAAPAAASGQTAAVPLTVALASAAAGQTASGALTVMAGPVLASVAPTSAVRGTAVGLTLTGVNLQGATALQVLRDGLLDATVTASGAVAAPDGTSLTCTLTLGGTAPLGTRVIQVVTPQGRSTALDIGTNHITVTAP